MHTNLHLSSHIKKNLLTLPQQMLEQEAGSDQL